MKSKNKPLKEWTKPNYLKVIPLTLLAWAALSLGLGKYEAAQDGFTEIGLPFTFYRIIGGKCNPCPIEGFLFQPFLFDLLTVLLIGFVISALVTLRSMKK